MPEDAESTVAVERCRSCGDRATHEVQPPNPDRDDWIPVCESHANELRAAGGHIREHGGGDE